jgi:hypothetical protein
VDLSIANGSQQAYQAVGTFADGAQVNLNSSVTWSSSTTSVANDNLGPNKKGRASIDVTAASGQTVTITATLGANSGTSTLNLGAFAYTANNVGDNVSVFTIDTGTGALTAGTAVNAGNGPRSVTVDPTGRFAYVANECSNDVSVFSIEPSGHDPVRLKQAHSLSGVNIVSARQAQQAGPRDRQWPQARSPQAGEASERLKQSARRAEGLASCFPSEFFVGKDVLDVDRDVVLGGMEQLRNL